MSNFDEMINLLSDASLYYGKPIVGRFIYFINSVDGVYQLAYTDGLPPDEGFGFFDNGTVSFDYSQRSSSSNYYMGGYVVYENGPTLSWAPFFYIYYSALLAVCPCDNNFPDFSALKQELAG